MKHAVKKAAGMARRSLSVLLAVTIMLSVAVVSMMPLSAATGDSTSITTSGQKLYINLTDNSDWSARSKATLVFSDHSGQKKGSSQQVSISSGKISVTTPSGASKLTMYDTSGVAAALSTLNPLSDGMHRLVLDASSVSSNDGSAHTYDNPYVHCYHSPTVDATTWPGYKMTKIGDTNYYYADIDSTYQKVNFSTQSSGETKYQTADLDINYGYNPFIAYYKGSNWSNPRAITFDFSKSETEIYNRDTEYYVTSDGKVQRSRYISDKGASQDTAYITYKNVYVYNTNWNSASKIYATWDFNDPFSATTTLTKTEYNGRTVFTGNIPEGALVKFHVNQSDMKGASESTLYPSSQGYGSGDNTATYKITNSSQTWCKASEIDSKSYDAYLGDKLESVTSNGDTIISVDATYYDYLSDNERAHGYLNNMAFPGDSGLEDWWYMFDNFNSKISSYASSHSAWKYPLYFGNFYNAGGYEGWVSSRKSSLTNFHTSSNYGGAVNNSNYMVWGGGNYNQSLMGLAYPTLSSSGDIQVAAGVDMPYFSNSYLMGLNNYAKVYKGVFPFRVDKNSSTGVTTYRFTSKDARDNVYFGWDGLTPKTVNYGAGEAFGIKDELSHFGGSADGYGIFPFNNRSATKTTGVPGSEVKVNVPSDEFWVKTGSYADFCLHVWEDTSVATKNDGAYFILPNKTENGYYKFKKSQLGSNTKADFEQYKNTGGKLCYVSSLNALMGKVIEPESGIEAKSYSKYYTKSSSSNENKNYGFGIRLDIDFRVPQYGTLNGKSSGDPVTFNFTGDDDLWIYIGEKNDGSDGKLVLDLAGDHKEAVGKIDFKAMQSTAYDVFADYSSDNSKQDTNPVPSDEFWVKSDSSYADFCLHVWQDTSVASQNDGAYFISPYSKSDGYYKFKRSQLGSNTAVDFEKYKNTSGKLCYISDISYMYGNVINPADGSVGSAGSVSSNPTNLGKVRTPFKIGSGDHLDPNKTYHMTVFYMERGESESNFSLDFTMTPATNSLAVNNILDTGDVVSAIAEDLIANEKYNYAVTENGSSTEGKSYMLNGKEATLKSGSDAFTLKHEGNSLFDNTFKTESDMMIKESYANSALSYTTTWELYNRADGKTISQSTASKDKQSDFELVNPYNKNEYAALNLDYVNKIDTAELNLTKRVVDENGNSYATSQPFDFTLMLDLDGSGSMYQPKAYPVEYVVDGETYIAYNGIITLQKNQTAKIINLPKGATYSLTEKNYSNYSSTVSSGTLNGTIGVNTAVTVVNKPEINTTELTINKTLDGEYFTGTAFNFSIHGISGSAKTIDTSTEKATVSQAKNGDVTFKGNTMGTNKLFEFVDSGVYCYVITESVNTAGSVAKLNYTDKSFIMDGGAIVAKITYNSDTKKSDKVYYKLTKAQADAIDTSSTSYNTYSKFIDGASLNSAVFENNTRKGSVTVGKKNQSGDNLSNTTFALVKVTEEDAISDEFLMNATANDSINAILGVTGNDGTVTFTDLDVFQNGDGMYSPNGWTDSAENYTNGAFEPQVYCLYEFEAPDGYNPTLVKQYFTLPLNDDYDITLQDVIDSKLLHPDTSGSGMAGWIIAGIAITCVGSLLAGAYLFFVRTPSRKARARAKARR